jgi:hypothetical protein
MSNLKTLSAIAILSVAMVSPVFAAGNDGGGRIGPGGRYRPTPQSRPIQHVTPRSGFLGANNQWDGRYESSSPDREPRWLGSANGG